MKKTFKSLIIAFILINCFLIVGCKNSNLDYIQVSKIYVSSTNANNNNTYEMRQLKIDIIDYKNKTYNICEYGSIISTIYKTNLEESKNGYFSNFTNEIPIYNEEYTIQVNLTIYYNGEYVNLTKENKIKIYKIDSSIRIKNIDTPAFAYASLVDMQLSDNSNEHFQIILSAYEIEKN